MLEARNVTAKYGPLVALRGVSLFAGPGEMVGIFGHNGAGKTTLLRCLVGAHRDMTGTVTLEGKPVQPGAVHRNVRMGIGFVPQGRNLFHNMSVEENLRIAALTHSLTPLEDVYQLFPILTERQRQRAGTLSGGEQQMLALAMALIARPRVLLLDEPTTGLAPIVVREILRTLKEINRQHSATVVIVEQNVRATLAVVDRAVVLKSGRIIFDGAAAELALKRDLWEWF